MVFDVEYNKKKSEYKNELIQKIEANWSYLIIFEKNNSSILNAI